MHLTLYVCTIYAGESSFVYEFLTCTSRIYEQETRQRVEYGLHGYTNRKHASVCSMGFTDIRTGNMPACGEWASRIYEGKRQRVENEPHGYTKRKHASVWSMGFTDIRTGNMPACVVWASRMSEVVEWRCCYLNAADKQSVAVVIMKVWSRLPNAPSADIQTGGGLGIRSK